MSELSDLIRRADDDEWTIAEGTIDGRPSMVRFRPSLSKVLGNPLLPRRLVVIWEYGDDGDSGMPDAEISEDLELFENALTEALDSDRAGVLAFVFTHLGFREWHYYFSTLNVVGERINDALSEQPDLPIELKAFDDPDWNELAAVIDSVRDNLDTN
jgi:hypothetical protein